MEETTIKWQSYVHAVTYLKSVWDKAVCIEWGVHGGGGGVGDDKILNYPSYSANLYAYKYNKSPHTEWPL